MRVYQTGLNRLKRDHDDYIGLMIRGEYEILNGHLADYKATLRASAPIGDGISIPEFQEMWTNFGRGLTMSIPKAIDQDFPGIDNVQFATPVSSVGDRSFGAQM